MPSTESMRAASTRAKSALFYSQVGLKEALIGCRVCGSVWISDDSGPCEGTESEFCRGCRTRLVERGHQKTWAVVVFKKGINTNMDGVINSHDTWIYERAIEAGRSEHPPYSRHAAEGDLYSPYYCNTLVDSEYDIIPDFWAITIITGKLTRRRYAYHMIQKRGTKGGGWWLGAMWRRWEANNAWAPLPSGGMWHKAFRSHILGDGSFLTYNKPTAAIGPPSAAWFKEKKTEISDHPDRRGDTLYSMGRYGHSVVSLFLIWCKDEDPKLLDASWETPDLAKLTLSPLLDWEQRRVCNCLASLPSSWGREDVAKGLKFAINAHAAQVWWSLSRIPQLASRDGIQNVGSRSPPVDVAQVLEGMNAKYWGYEPARILGLWLALIHLGHEYNAMFKTPIISVYAFLTGRLKDEYKKVIPAFIAGSKGIAPPHTQWSNDDIRVWCGVDPTAIDPRDVPSVHRFIR